MSHVLLLIWDQIQDFQTLYMENILLLLPLPFIGKYLKKTAKITQKNFIWIFNCQVVRNGLLSPHLIKRKHILTFNGPEIKEERPDFISYM